MSKLSSKNSILILWFTSYFFDFLRISLTSATILVLFCDKLGLDKSRIGIIWSLPSFLGSLSIFIVPTIKKIGYKYAACSFLSIRNLLPFGFLLTPYFAVRFGPNMGFLWLAGILLLSSLAGAFGATAMGLWSVEIIPADLRGRIMGASVIIGSIGYILGISFGGFWLETSKELSTFIMLFLIGNIAGIAPLICYSLLPKEQKETASENIATFTEIRSAFSDKDFILFLVSIFILNLISQGVGAFTSLYMKDYVGISSGLVMQLGTWAWIGILLFTYVWGWLADRFGGKNSLFLSFWIHALFPIVWLLLPRHQGLFSFTIAAIVSFVFGGLAMPSYMAGIERFFPLTLLPKDSRRNAYYAIYSAVSGISCGLGPIIAGYVLDLSKQIEPYFVDLQKFHIDPYSPLFVLHIVMPLIGIKVLGSIKTDGWLSTKELVFLISKSFPVGIYHLLWFSVYRRMAKTKSQRLRLYGCLKKIDPCFCIPEIKNALKDPDIEIRQCVLQILRSKPLNPRLENILADYLNSDGYMQNEMANVIH